MKIQKPLLHTILGQIDGGSPQNEMIFFNLPLVLSKKINVSFYR